MTSFKTVMNVEHKDNRANSVLHMFLQSRLGLWGVSTHGSGGVGHDLGSAVGESDLVTSSSVVTITLLVGVEVAEGVVILDSVGVFVHRGLVRVGHGGGGAVHGDSVRAGGGQDSGQEGGGENSLKHQTSNIKHQT